MIDIGKIKYGEIYSISNLAAEMEMSKTPVRDAVQRLSDENRIDLLPSRGFRLHKITDDELLQMYHFSNAVEGYCVYCLAVEYKKGNKKDYVERLQQLLDKMIATSDSSYSFEEFYGSDNEFHHVIILSLEDDVFKNLSYSKRGFYNHLELHLTKNPVNRLTIIECHKKILDAICAGDPTGAYNAILEHSDYVYNNYTQQDVNG